MRKLKKTDVNAKLLTGWINGRKLAINVRNQSDDKRGKKVKRNRRNSRKALLRRGKEVRKVRVQRRVRKGRCMGGEEWVEILWGVTVNLKEVLILLLHLRNPHLFCLFI